MRERAGPSCQDFLDDISAHVSEPEVTTGMAKGEALVVQAHQVQDGGVEVMDVDGVFRHFDAVVVAGAVGEPAFYAPASKP